MPLSLAMLDLLSAYSLAYSSSIGLFALPSERRIIAHTASGLPSSSKRAVASAMASPMLVHPDGERFSIFIFTYSWSEVSSTSTLETVAKETRPTRSLESFRASMKVQAASLA